MQRHALRPAHPQWGIRRQHLEVAVPTPSLCWIQSAHANQKLRCAKSQFNHLQNLTYECYTTNLVHLYIACNISYTTVNCYLIIITIGTTYRCSLGATTYSAAQGTRTYESANLCKDARGDHQVSTQRIISLCKLGSPQIPLLPALAPPASPTCAATPSRTSERVDPSGRLDFGAFHWGTPPR